MNTTLVKCGISISIALLLGGCVPQSRYDAAVQDAQSQREQALSAADAAARKIAEEQTQLAQLNAALLAARKENDSNATDLGTARASLDDLQKKLDAATAEDAQLRKELERLGKNADKLLAEKGSLASALDQAKSRLEELRKAQAAADARAALFRSLAMKFQKMIDAGELKIVLRDGRMVIQLANDVLFDSGRTTIKPTGDEALKDVAAVLKTLDHRRFQVAGHTDSVPIRNSHYGSNWELSTARAVEVVRYLVSQGVRPEVLSAAGYGEFDPVASNDDDVSRGKNRRIEITLQPNIDELVAVPSTASAK